ncbi:OLC1v1034491C1 [Oldenlandia corymbosa var. corymbosa]|uniref:OLC1v1034491C1 n=1 Tax=Oldenlandia corymbosa var. corymbosa TaxID=529605 RepID=A0AAV1CQS0_OLDCO|nr:OLC1v1034491C1 [Oldenlandia corymbosa var. corymbosa]
MATLSHWVPFHHPSSSHKLSSSFSFPLPSLRSVNPPWKPDSNHSIFCTSATKKPRSRSRKTKSDEDLRNDIKQFLSDVGLPPDHVPSTKELSAHGRQDLANIVRRRGYKFMKELLAPSFETQTISYSQTVSTGLNEEVDTSSGGMSLSTEDAKLLHQDIDSVKDDSMSSEASLVKVDESACAEVASSTHGAAEAIVWEGYTTSDEADTELPPENHIPSTEESSVHPWLQEKVEKFIQHGELDSIEENDLTLCGAEVLNGSVASSSHQMEDREFQMYPSRIESGSTDETKIVSPEDEAQKTDDQNEINRLKKFLHQKELELIQLKEQLENEKLALSMFQTRAQREISEAQKRISDKDAELHATEEILSGMEEVEIQFWSEGEVVEVAGSFNGWHQSIKMESQPPSSISVATRSQKSRLWKTLLWLYPGVYEIKFIVDGHWTVDPHRDFCGWLPEPINQPIQLHNFLPNAIAALHYTGSDKLGQTKFQNAAARAYVNFNSR